MNNEVRTGHLSHAPMTPRDWGYLAVFLVVAALAGTWMGIELRKPFGITWEGGIVHQESPIEITEVGDKTVLKNKKLGFELSVQKDWTIQSAQNRKIVVSNSDCKINFEVVQETSNFQVLISEVKKNFDIFTVQAYTEKYFEIQNKPALEIFLNTLETGEGYTLFVLDPPNVYGANMYITGESEVGCVNQWEEFKRGLKL
jgi:hypothetical protein